MAVNYFTSRHANVSA